MSEKFRCFGNTPLYADYHDNEWGRPVHDDNSYRVMERNGMRREALHVKAFWARVDKEWIDKAVYAILADEYQANQMRGTK